MPTRHTHRIVHDVGCDYEGQIVNKEEPLCVSGKEQITQKRDRLHSVEVRTTRDAYCSCGANPRLRKPRRAR